jgi:peptide/nickel transport system substrate-binding protein/oligopeptide transport system substrate-binding protein
MFFSLSATQAAEFSIPKDFPERFGGVYRRPLAQAPTSLDPARATDVYAYMVVNQLFDGLVQFDEYLTPLPAMAGFWEASLDGLSWTFYLRQGVKFHNGREVTADDFVYSFTRILDPALQSPVAELFRHIRGAEAFQAGKTPTVEGLQAVDRHTLRIFLREPYAPFLSILAMANAKVVPREEVNRLGDQFGRHPVGSGPFTFRSWESKQRLVIQAFDYYYEGRPFLNQIVFEIGRQEMESFNDFLERNLEEAIVPITKAAEIRELPRYHTYVHLKKPMLHLLYIGFNTQKAPFTNPKVRQAFSYAVNTEAIMQEIRLGISTIAQGILPPGMPAYNPDVARYYYSPRRAKQLLAEAGYPDGKGIPIIDLWYSSKEESTPRELEAYREDLAELGVTIEIHQAADWPTFQKLLAEGKALMFRLAWYSDIPDPDNFLYPLLHSQSKTNRTFYRNARVDRLLEEARSETDYLQRIQLYRQVEQIVLQDAPWINQHHRVFEYLYQPYVRGVETSPLGAHYIPMKKIWLKQPGTRKEIVAK